MLGYADAGADGYLVISDADGRPHEQLEKSLSDDDGLLKLAVVADDYELVTAEATERVTAAEAGGEPLHKLAEDVIADLRSGAARHPSQYMPMIATPDAGHTGVTSLTLTTVSPSTAAPT